MDGTNYTTWEYPMRAYLKFKGCWLITVEGLPDIANQETPFWYIQSDPKSAPEERAIKQRLTNAIIEEIKGYTTAKDIWKYLKNKYNKAGSAQVFGDIQKVYTFQIKGNQNPEAEISKLALLFTCLKARGAEMSKFYQAMTLLNAGLMKWPHLVSIYLSQNDMKDLDFDKIKVMFIADWHRTTTLGQPSPKINKISGVQQKKKDLKWKKGKGKDNAKSDSSISPPSSSDSKNSSGRKFRGASAMVPHYTSTVSTIDSRPSVPPQKYQGTPTKGAWETVPEAISLLHRMGIKPSIQSVKTMEQPLLELTEDYPVTKKQKFTPEPLSQESNIIPDSEPITVPNPEVVIDWDNVISLGEEPQETYTEAEIVEDSTTIVDESMDYLFEELIQNT
ncbi:hypothetical protein AMATHDRAFT_9728 [Amanita thiersii Skay4041]|uniref:Uncharacterized protein n=1 Tax=Amanita thiersii Skay4041 TaxID=703135 RepID=A0A2A9NBV7_9AGAR|nr:hypothetical protein AMATHDRAFT_9728 [Amanita thiersii Skay4041]